MNVAKREQRQPLTWLEIRSELKQYLTARDATVWQRWFEPVTGIVEQEENNTLTLRLVCPTNFYGDWIRNNYEIFISEAWRQFAPDGKVVFSVQPQQQPKAEKVQFTAEVIQLPLWPEPVRGMPNPVLRAALFAAIQGKDRRFLNDENLAAVQGVIIRFKGEQMNQEDLDVCSAVYHLARMHPLGDIVHTSAHGFLKLLGRKTGKSQHVQLHRSFRRLMQPLEIETKRYQYGGALIMKGVKDKESRHYILKVNPELEPLFRQGWTGIDWQQRQNLRGKPLALWLHSFYASHAQPHPYKVETLRELCGSQAKILRSFRQQLREALDHVQIVGAIEGYAIDTADLVHIRKTKAITSPQKNLKRYEK